MPMNPLPIKQATEPEEAFTPVGAFAFFLSLLVFFVVIWVAMYAWMLSREYY